MGTILEFFLLIPMFIHSTTAPEPPMRLDRIWTQCKIVEMAAPEEKKTVYNMSVEELNALSLNQKAKLIHMNKKTFKTFVKLVNREAGAKMNDKIMVAAVVWNRKYCKQYPDTVRKVMYQGGQFTIRGQKNTEIHGNANDKKAQLAILLAYRMLKSNQLPHNVHHFNNISFRQGDPARFKRYKHYNNYFVRDTKCKCDWCRASR